MTIVTIDHEWLISRLDHRGYLMSSDCLFICNTTTISISSDYFINALIHLALSRSWVFAWQALKGEGGIWERESAWGARGRKETRTRAWSRALIPLPVACVASVSNRVIARKLEREQPLPLPHHSFFFVPTFSTNSRGNACYAGYFPFPFERLPRRLVYL